MTIEKIHKTTFRNRKLIENTTQCHCGHCLRSFPPDKIEEWTDPAELEGPGMTALCPFCGIDCVIPDAPGITPEVVTEIHEKYFHQTKDFA